MSEAKFTNNSGYVVSVILEDEDRKQRQHTIKVGDILIVPSEKISGDLKQKVREGLLTIDIVGSLAKAVEPVVAAPVVTEEPNAGETENGDKAN